MSACLPSPAETDREWQDRIVACSALNAEIARLETEGFRKCFKKTGHNGRWTIERSLWEADHIQPRVLGGGEDLENYRTLCVPCHKAATKRLARFLKLRRRKGMDMFYNGGFR
jgi:5-methylcytosine-specific restriction endonuclease McrA